MTDGTKTIPDEGMVALFFDTETTGFPSESKPIQIVQIAAILQRVDGDRRVLGEINLIVKPTIPIPQEVIDIHGIDDQLAERFGVSVSYAESSFIQLLEMADVVVAHNIDFDEKATRNAWPAAYPLLASKQHYCTMLNAVYFDIPKRHAGKSKWPKLSDAYRYFFGKDFENAHDAMADVRACRDIYFAINKLNQDQRGHDKQH